MNRPDRGAIGRSKTSERLARRVGRESFLANDLIGIPNRWPEKIPDPLVLRF